MAPYIMGNGPRKAFVMAKEPSAGKTEASSWATGRMIKPMVEVDSFTLTAMHMRVTGLMIKLKVEEHTSTWTAPSTSVTGKKIDNTATELRPGQIMPNMRATMNMARSMESVHSSGRMAHLILVSSTTIISTAREFTHGLTTGFTKENGERIKCMAKERSHGQTEGSMSANMLKIRREAMANSSGLMDDATEASGSTGNNTGREPMSPAVAKKNMANGKTVRE